MLGFSFSNEFPGIPTRDEWVQLTTGVFVQHRGTDLIAIDTALGHYHQTLASQAVVKVNEKGAHYANFRAVITKMRIVTLQLCSLIDACGTWLANKTESGEIGSSSRAPLVRRLAAHAFDKVKVLLPEGKGFDAEDPSVYLNLVAADIRWRMILPLIHNFTKDNLVFFNKERPGKQLHILNIMESNPGGVNPEHFVGEGVAVEFSKQTEFNNLFDFVRQAETNCHRVLYLQEDQRWEHQFLIVDGLVHRVDRKGDPTKVKRTGTGEASNLLISAKTHRMYLLDHDIMTPALREYDRQRLGLEELTEDGFEHLKLATQYRHSTFLAGEPCFFAGAMKIDPEEGGRIIEIDNCSGHYQPKPQAIIEAIKLMNASGHMQLDRISITVGMNHFSNGTMIFDGVPNVCTADIAVRDPEEFNRAICKAQIRQYEIQLNELGNPFTIAQRDHAAALGVVGIEDAIVIGSPTPPKTSKISPTAGRVETSRPFKIRTNVNFF